MVWAFAGGVPVLVPRSAIDDQVKALKPYLRAAVERFARHHRATRRQEAAAPVARERFKIPSWPMPERTSEQLAAQRATSWAAMRSWIEGQRTATFGLPAGLLQADVKKNTESAPGSAGTDQHQNQE